MRYLVDNYNQRLDARMGDQTRFQRWESGLIAMPKLLSERELDICLMKQARRQIQRGGYLQFENLMYRGDNLVGYGGESVVVRFDPRDIAIAKSIRTFFLLVRAGGLCIPSGDFNRCVLTALAVAISRRS